MDLRIELDHLKQNDLLRELRTFGIIDAVRLDYQGRTVLNFASNDYLGLSKDARVINAAVRALESYGTGSGASRLVSGSLIIHAELEERIAAFKRKERAVAFPTGYMANVGIINALFSKGDQLIIDKLSHASIIDACAMSQAEVRVFPHKNYKRLREILKRTSSFKKRCIITDSVFSMDGDCADLRELIEIKHDHGAILMIDEAHATGVFGTFGRGLAEEQGVEDEIDICMGTLSKALGGLGGYIAGDNDLIRFMHNKARSFIYTTALSPATCAGIIAAIDIIEEDISLRQTLWNNVKMVQDYLKDIIGINVGSQSPIIPVIVGESTAALELSDRMLERGFFMPAVRYPTVPRKSARLRISLSAAHTENDIRRMLNALGEEYSKIIG